MLWALIVILIIIALVSVPVVHSLWGLLLLIVVALLIFSALGGGTRA